MVSIAMSGGEAIDPILDYNYYYIQGAVPEQDTPMSLEDWLRNERKTLKDYEASLLSDLTPKEQLALRLGQLVDQGIRPNNVEDYCVIYIKEPLTPMERLVRRLGQLEDQGVRPNNVEDHCGTDIREPSWNSYKIKYELIDISAGAISPAPTWHRRIDQIARELGIAIPRTLVASQKTDCDRVDYLALVREIDDVVRLALLGRPPVSLVNQAQAVNPDEYKRLLEIKSRIDPQNRYIGNNIQILRIFELIEEVKESDKSYPILGPSGSGNPSWPS